MDYMRQRGRLAGLLLLIGAAGSLLLAPAADARDWRGGFVLQAQGQPAKKGPGPHRNGNGDGGKRPEFDKPHHKGRLTQEERRELRRDLDRANREIYRR